MSQPFPPPGEHDFGRPTDAPPPPAAPPDPHGRGPFSPPPWGPWPYAAPVEHPRGVLILVLGILSIAACALLGPVAWGMGAAALREIDARPGAYSNRSEVRAGEICGIVGTAIIALDVLFVALLFLLGRDA